MQVKTEQNKIAVAKLIERLHDPIQLRVLITALMLAVGYAGVYVPLSDRITETSRELDKELKHQALVDDVEHLKGQVDQFRARLPEDTDTNEWVQYVLGGVRKSPMKLVDLDSDSIRRVGPYEAVVLRIELEGEYQSLESFLAWLEGNERLFRMDSARIAPSRYSAGQLVMQLNLLGLKN